MDGAHRGRHFRRTGADGERSEREVVACRRLLVGTGDGDGDGDGLVDATTKRVGASGSGGQSGRLTGGEQKAALVQEPREEVVEPIELGVVRPTSVPEGLQHALVAALVALHAVALREVVPAHEERFDPSTHRAAGTIEGTRRRLIVVSKTTV